MSGRWRHDWLPAQASERGYRALGWCRYRALGSPEASAPPRRCHNDTVADLNSWKPAVPEGQQLVAAAPMIGDWAVPFIGGIGYQLSWFPIGFAAIALADRINLALVYGVLVLCHIAFVLWWYLQHPRPDGMAAVLNRRDAGPVLLVTNCAILAADMRRSSTLVGRAEPAGAARPLPGLLSVEAVGERLVLRFEDGSQACLRQRRRTPGAAARVAALAEPVLSMLAPASASHGGDLPTAGVRD